MRINKRFYVIALITFLLFLAWIAFSDELLLSLWVGFLLVIIISWFISINSLTEIQVGRFSRKKILEIGDTFEERLEIKNNSKITKFWIEIKDHSKLLASISSRVITGLGANNISAFTSVVRLNKRGFFLLGPTELISGDPFGLFNCSRLFLHKNSLTVYPKIDKLYRFPSLPADKSGGEAMHLQSPYPTPQAAGVREYSPGDPLSRVHWPTTIKHDKLMVKEFDEDTQSSVWILMDAEKGKYVRQPAAIEPAIDRNFISVRKTKEYLLPCDSFEYAVSIAASITKYYLGRDLMVGFACASKDAFILPSEKGHRQLNKILEKLAIVEDKGVTPFELLIEKQVNNISKGSALILISSFDDLPNENIMKKLRRRGFQVVTVILNNKSFAQNYEKTGDLTNKPPVSTIIVSYGDDIEKILSSG